MRREVKIPFTDDKMKDTFITLEESRKRRNKMTNDKLANLLTKAIMDSEKEVQDYNGFFMPSEKKTKLDGELLKAKINVIIDMLEVGDE